jgi:hypothetical protein
MDSLPVQVIRHLAVATQAVVSDIVVAEHSRRGPLPKDAGGVVLAQSEERLATCGGSYDTHRCGDGLGGAG